MVIRIKVMTGWVLLIANLMFLAWLCVKIGWAGLGIEAIAGAIQLRIWASIPQDTPERKRQRETGYIREGGIYYQGKRISWKEAKKRGLKLELDDEPKPKRKPNFWTGR